MANITQKLLKELNKGREIRTPIATDMFLPNVSGDHSKSRVRKTATTDLEIANKKYVDTTSTANPIYVAVAGDTMTGDLIIESNTSSGLIIRTTDTSDPSLHFVSTNSAHDFDLHLDESATNDVLTLEGHTASVDTDFQLKALTGQAARFHILSGSNEGHFKMDASGDLEILNENTDKDIVFKYTHAAEDHNITISAENNKLTHSTGTFDFDDDNLTTTGTLDSGNLDVTGTGTFSSDVTITGAGTKSLVLTETGNTVTFAASATTTTGNLGTTTNHGIVIITNNTTAATISTAQNLTLAGSLTIVDNNVAAFGSGADARISYDATDMVIDSATVGSGVIKFANATNWTANGAGTVTISNLAPSGVGTATISQWLTVKNNAGTVMYIPAWT